MKILVTNLQTGKEEYNGCAEELLESLLYPFDLEIALSDMEENQLNKIKFTDDDGFQYLIEKEMELIYD